MERDKDKECRILQQSADRLGALVGTRLSVMAYKHGYVLHGCTSNQVGGSVGTAKSFDRMLSALNFAVAVCEDAILAHRRGRPEWPGTVCKRIPGTEDGL